MSKIIYIVFLSYGSEAIFQCAFSTRGKAEDYVTANKEPSGWPRLLISSEVLDQCAP